MNPLVTALTRALTRYLHTIVVSTVVSLAVGLAAGALLWWPWTQIPFLVFGLSPTLGGYVAFFSAVARRRALQPSLLLTGFRRIDRWTGVFVMTGLHLTLAALPLCVGMAMGNLAPPNVRWLWWSLGSLAALPLVILMLGRLFFVAVVAVDAPESATVADLFERATDIAGRRRWAVFGAVTLVVGLIAVATVYVGWLLPVVGAVGILLQVSLYDILAAAAAPVAFDGPAAPQMKDELPPAS